MWVYEQRTGRLRQNDTLRAVCYSGHAEGKNNPAMQHVKGVGPIPVGAYLIGSESESLAHGPVALHLIPLTGTDTLGRGSFLLHADSIEHPGEASEGCIAGAQRPLREAIRDGTDRLLVVLSGNPVL